MATEKKKIIEKLNYTYNKSYLKKRKVCLYNFILFWGRKRNTSTMDSGMTDLVNKNIKLLADNITSSTVFNEIEQFINFPECRLLLTTPYVLNIFVKLLAHEDKDVIFRTLTIIRTLTDFFDSVTAIVQHPIIDALLKLLKDPIDNEWFDRYVCLSITRCCKFDIGRTAFIDHGLIPIIIPMLIPNNNDDWTYRRLMIIRAIALTINESVKMRVVTDVAPTILKSLNYSTLSSEVLYLMSTPFKSCCMKLVEYNAVQIIKQYIRDNNLQGYLYTRNEASFFDLTLINVDPNGRDVNLNHSSIMQIYNDIEEEKEPIELHLFTASNLYRTNVIGVFTNDAIISTLAYIIMKEDAKYLTLKLTLKLLSILMDYQNAQANLQDENIEPELFSILRRTSIYDERSMEMSAMAGSILFALGKRTLEIMAQRQAYMIRYR